MSKTGRRPKSHLLEREASGGAIAASGFHFQANIALAYIANWLSHDGFEAVTVEAMGDVEAKFLVPGHGRQLELGEVKDHELSGTEFWAEIERFGALDRDHPGIYRHFTLVCDGLPQALAPLLNGLNRVRRPWDFYNEADSIQKASFKEFVEIARGLRRTPTDAKFMFEKVSVETDSDAARKHGIDLFIGVLCQGLPEYEQLGRDEVALAHSRLKGMLESHLNKPISRLELENTLRNAIDPSRRPDWRSVHLHTLIQDDEQHGSAITFRWGRFFGANERHYPPPAEWNGELVRQLAETRDWIAHHRGTRRVRLTGNRRLSTSLAIGSALRAVAGFAIEVEGRGGEYFRTDDYATPETPAYPVREELKPGHGTRLVVTIGIIRNIVAQVNSCLPLLGLEDQSQLLIASDQPIVSASQANLAVQHIKQSIENALQNTGCDEIHLFLAGPAFLAILLGHRLNAVGPIQCYEWAAPDHYLATCYLTP